MEFTNSYNEYSNQSIMATILKSLPNDSGLTKIEYEGPSIALYTTKPKFLMENIEILATMVNTIRRRIVVRTDHSIRKSKEDSIAIIKKNFPTHVEIKEIFFDEALGEITIYTNKFLGIDSTSQTFTTLDLVSETGWKVKVRKSPVTLSTIKFIDNVLTISTEYRAKFHREVGEKLFREKLNNTFEASIITLGGFGEIGRSCFLLVTKESKILVDCGINIHETRTLNYFPRFDITGFNIDQIDAVVISHAHIDHTGFLPFLFKYGYRGPVYCTEPTLPLMVLLFLDYHKNHKLYSENDIQNVVIHTIPLNRGVVTDIAPDVKLVMSNSGHILGSTSIHLHIGNGDHNIVYTGDLKFGNTNLLDNASWNFPRVETLIIEGTFGIKEQPHKREQSDPLLVASINETLRSNGQVLIPIPIIGLSQELLYTLQKYQSIGTLDPADIFVEESILEITRLHEMYPEYLSKEIKTKAFSNDSSTSLFNYDNIISINSSKSKLDKAAIILAPSSMLTGGLSTELLKVICTEPNNKMILLSYQLDGTPGKEIQSGSSTVIINSEKFEIKCKVDSIHGFSNHSDYNQLLAYVSRLKPKLKRVIVNHGEKPKVQNLTSSVNKVLNIPCHYLVVPEATKIL